MESYEEFCVQSLDRLRAEGKTGRTVPRPASSLEKDSVLCFHGRPVLAPLLSEAQRGEMSAYRDRARQLEVELRARQRCRLLARVQGILEQAQVSTKLALGHQPHTALCC
ncbi:centriolar coiled-coil protein of 110 kDa-like [Aplochiton taeniatus]